MSRRAAAGLAGAVASLLVAAAAFVIVGGLPGLLYAGGVATTALFLALKLGGASLLIGEGRWQRKSTIIAGLRVELEDRERQIAELANQLEHEIQFAGAVQTAHKARIEQLEQVRDDLQALLDDERARFAHFLGELSGGIDGRGGELAALERELTALVGG